MTRLTSLRVGMVCGFAVSAFAACGPESHEVSSTVDVGVEVELLVRRGGGPGESIVVFPLSAPARGGPAKVACLVDAARLDVSWTETGPLPNFEDGIQIKGFTWRLMNPLKDAADNTLAPLEGGPSDLALRKEWFTLGDSVPMSQADREKGEALLRARWMATARSPVPLTLKPRRTSDKPPDRAISGLAPF